jgi:hypothetical protein
MPMFVNQSLIINYIIMKKALLSVAFMFATIVGVNAQSVTWNQSQLAPTENGVTLTDANGYFIFPSGALTGTLTAVEITATKISGTTPAGELSIYITPTSAFEANGLLYAGGSSNALEAAEWQPWPNNNGNTISGMITLNTPITFTSTTTVVLANLYLQGTEATWDNVTVTLYGVEAASYDYCHIFLNGPYNDFNTILGGAPTVEGQVNEITEFEAWASEAYTVDGFIQGNEYTFSICNGPGAGSWTPDFTVFAPNGDVVAYGSDANSPCSITWTATESGTYIIAINEAGNCGVAGNVDNGFPAITNNGLASVNDYSTFKFSVYPNPANDVINVSYADAINTITITDLNGRVVKQVVLGANEAQINIADLSQGVYILNASANGKSITEKIVKK